MSPLTSSNLADQGALLSPMVLLPGIGMILVAVAFLVFCLRRRGGWAYLGLGALAWIVTVAVKFGIAIAANPAVRQVIGASGGPWAATSLLYDVYAGMLTGVTEVLMTWLLLSKTRLGHAPWRNVLAFGVGFGAFEALLLGLSSLAVTATALFAPASLPVDAVNAVSRSNDILYALAPATERAAVIFVHIFCNALLFYGVMCGQVRWMWVSFVYKSLLDSVAGFAQSWGVETVARLWTIEACMIAFAVVAWWGIREIAKRYRPEVAPNAATAPAPAIGG